MTTFEEGTFTSPIRILVNGRITQGVGGQFAPFYNIAFETMRRFLEAELIDFDFFTNAKVIWEVTSNGTRGFVDPQRTSRDAINRRFCPKSLDDLPETTFPLANDTAMGVAWAPYTALERAILELETMLTSRSSIEPLKWLGTDCKIMGMRNTGETSLTISIPIVAKEVRSRSDYFDKLQMTSDFIREKLLSFNGLGKVNFDLNPGDETDSECLYIRKTGSCLESGDEGQVGRGNRFGGVISARRGYSIEAVNGKNPAYHGGKLYSAMAQEIANKIYQHFDVANEVILVSQIDRPISDPWQVMVASASDLPKKEVEEIVRNICSNPARVTQGFLDGIYRTC
jgi:S-adenosylmethionine synthetase